MPCASVGLRPRRRTAIGATGLDPCRLRLDSRHPLGLGLLRTPPSRETSDRLSAHVHRVIAVGKVSPDLASCRPASKQILYDGCV